ncbi:MAG TPA: ATPase, T2SS/T4P/T4SS family [Magnetospirillaceae bacterium]|nr:ATPase, T2SS/T4P/T4SS family [Magnetospirillaceae bacterium]
MIPISDVRKVSGGVAKTKVTSAKPKGQSVFGDASPAAAMVSALLADAVAAGASAVHIEPHSVAASIRYRIDGLLHEGKPVPADALKNLTKRFKQLANLDVSESRLPQDGRFDATFAKRPYIVRVSVLPVTDGEKIVAHIAEQTGVGHDLEKLGYWGQTLQVMREATDTARGLVLVGGPAGTGKTSTLYGLLSLAAKPSLSIATVEDVIEHRLTGVTQTVVHSKTNNATFANTLRAVLRQDPNVVMVSDIHEPDTASQALHAALGGHLVLAGLQSRDLAASLAHLAAMHVEPYVIATAIRALANQRLVRRLCPNCRQSYTPSASEFDALCKAAGLPVGGVRAHLTNLQSIAAADLQVAPATLAGSKVTLWRANEKGCEQCGSRGYKGRIVIVEAMAVSPAIQRLLMSNAHGGALYTQAMQDGMVPLPLDGLVKVVLGLTSVEEVLQALQK